MSKSQKYRPVQNRKLYDAMQERRRSNAATPERNKTKYSRSDYRRSVQRGEVY